MGYPESAWERAMTVQEVMLKAMSGEIALVSRGGDPGVVAPDACGGGGSGTRRTGTRAWSTSGCTARRLHRAPPGEVERVLQLYRERYRGFNVRHFHRDRPARARGDAVVQLGEAGVADGRAGRRSSRPRGRHRRRREPRACFGELLHIDGSPHAWFALGARDARDADRRAR